jgi:hypothetical protein
MTQEKIIEIARQAGFVDYELDDGTTNAFDKRYEAFAKLVRNHYSYTHAHLWLTRIEDAVKAEREDIICLVGMYGGPVDLEAAIRARGEA